MARSSLYLYLHSASLFCVPDHRTTKPTPHLDGIHVVFGQVISGQEVIRMIESQKTDANSRPYAEVKVLNCGELVPKSKAKKEKKKHQSSSESDDDSSSDSSSDSEESEKDKKRQKKHKKEHKKKKEQKLKKKDKKGCSCPLHI